ncbi:hypothetical protein NPIL_407861 [Nephila pilipes]|uniref:Uncharacterized protein n=1 Tax=Nephila pilipes TaxID=299642 RepID=A0A8X6MY98_NEPPI|nr:hypothetical protein NPIL_407861 [Nephila pilipes]
MFTQLRTRSLHWKAFLNNSLILQAHPFPIQNKPGGKQSFRSDCPFLLLRAATLNKVQICVTPRGLLPVKARFVHRGTVKLIISSLPFLETSGIGAIRKFGSSKS